MFGENRISWGLEPFIWDKKDSSSSNLSHASCSKFLLLGSVLLKRYLIVGK